MSGSARVRSAVIGVLATTALSAVAGCGGPDDELVRPTPRVSVAPYELSDLPVLPTGKGGVRPGDRVRASGTDLIVRGRRISLAPLRADQVAVVPGGVYFRNGTELWFTDLTRAQATGFENIASVVASADGRRIGFVDLGHGPADKDGTRLAAAVAYDAVTGRPLVATYAGMGDLAGDDLSELYGDHPPTVLGFTGTAMRLRGATGDYLVPLNGDDPVRFP